MPWYEVPVRVVLDAEDAEQARGHVMDLLSPADNPRRVFPEGAPARELTPEQVQAHLRLVAILRQAEEDSAAGRMTEVAGYPGVKFSPGAAAALAALRFEAQDPAQ
jgi:hypothetical protein